MKASEFINEDWSQKYKSSINCSHPKGFSQKAHCAGKKKHNEDTTMEAVCPDCGMCQTHGSLNEIAKGAKDSNGFTKCWPGKHAEGTKKGKNGGRVRNCVPNESVAEDLNELANTSLDVKEPNDFVNTNDRKQVTWKVMKFKSGKDTYLINFTVQKSPTSGKMKNWNAVNVAFGVKEKQDDWSFGDEINTDLTARNKNQFLIYSTVINAVRKFITEYNTEIDEIIMQGAGERQEAMYQRFFQSAGKYFPGWHYNGKHSLVRDVPRPTGNRGVNEDWNKVNHHDKTNGLSQKAVNAYRRENPGSKLKTAVTTKPSKLKAGSKAAKRRKSFCARMGGNKGPMKKPNGKPTPKALALRRWNCESVEEMAQMIAEGEQMIAEMKQRLDPKCWKGKHKEGTKIKGGIRVNNCVPNESQDHHFAGAKAGQKAGVAGQLRGNAKPRKDGKQPAFNKLVGGA